MRALGNYIVRGRLQAVAIISLTAVLSLLMPPLAYLLSGVPVGLVTLRRGPAIGMQVIIGALLFTSMLVSLVNIQFAIAPAFALGIWAPIWLCSLVLRITESQGLLVLATGFLGIALVILMHVLLDDVSGWWQASMDAWLANNLPPESVAQYKELFESVMPLMNAMMASGLIVSIVTTVLLARCWQSALFNPGGFRLEFYKLRLPRALTLVAFICIFLTVIDTGLSPWLFRDLLIILVFMYLFQGLAAVHRTVFLRKLSTAWLFGMYSLLLLMPQMALFLACIGMADSWLGGEKSGQGGNG